MTKFVIIHIRCLSTCVYAVTCSTMPYATRKLTMHMDKEFLDFNLSATTADSIWTVII